ncbi:Cytochrome P450 E-class group I [Penicillium canariense]|uniref:Cytochrome P450 E-class group I n=1 Tax=Penicillium canariense TaxID=189055 RepID=A0A9W9LNI9_9EURO|nr:Cytochrome P450 E-class group I [Penicillium canariense]KAJ5166990.1 Cytochrome P450 E-class group I [Penicillium canariense]
MAFSGVPFEFVRHQMKQSCFVPSFSSNLLQNNPVEPGSEDENILKWSAGSLFFLAMALFPEVQHKAQQELDRVIGDTQLPQFSDRERLPYINALVKEVLRWHPVVPMNVAHASSQDDVCEGYLIPKGSSILANIWAFTHDPNVYHDPMVFNPERFLATSTSPLPERDPHLLVFGFGRRACPGRTLADANVFLSVAQSLAVFDIAKPVRNGQVQDIPLKFLPGVLAILLHLSCPFSREVWHTGG